MELNGYFKKVLGYIKKSDVIYIMSHDGLDIDAIASCIALADICIFYKRKYAIVIDERKHESGVAVILHEISDKYNIISSSKINSSKNSLLALVDVNKGFLLQNSNVLFSFERIIIIDHHEITKDTIAANLSIISSVVSSTSEIMTKFLQKIKIRINERTNTYLLAGIILDTNSFSLKTYASTYDAAYFLTVHGASNKVAQSLLKQDIEDYKLRQKAILDFIIINKSIALSVCSQKIIYKREELAKIADTLLEFNNIEMSFAVGKTGLNSVAISGRSSGRKSVGRLLEKIGGGGNKSEAACRFENKSIKDVVEELRKVI